MDKPNVLVVGSSNIDYIMQSPHLPQVGETVTDCTFMQTFGGKGANQAVAAARGGGQVTFVTCVGDDPITRQMTQGYADDGIDTRHIRVEPKINSGAALVMFDQQGANYLTVAPGANYALKPEHLDQMQSLFDHAAVLVMQMEIEPETTEAALSMAEERSLPVVFNYAPTRGVPLPVRPAMTMLVVNENEAGELADCTVSSLDDAAAAARKLRGMGPNTVVVTLGAQGVIALTDGEQVHVPAMTVKPVDTTAAGDTFCGALAVAMGEGKSLQSALRFATIAAAICVTGFGAQPSIPRRDAIEQMLRSVPR